MCHGPVTLCHNLVETEDRNDRSEVLFGRRYLSLLREIEVHIHGGMDVFSACRKAGVSDKTYYGWRRKYGGMSRAWLSEMKSLEKENQRLKKIVADLELDKLILKESLDYLKRKA